MLDGFWSGRLQSVPSRLWVFASISVLVSTRRCFKTGSPMRSSSIKNCAVFFGDIEIDSFEHQPTREQMENSTWDRPCAQEGELGTLALLGQRDFEAYRRESLELADSLEGGFPGKQLGSQHHFAAVITTPEDVKGRADILDGHPALRVFFVVRRFISGRLQAAHRLGGACGDV